MNSALSLIDLIRSDIAAWADIWSGNQQRGRCHSLITALRLLWSYVGLRATLLYRLSHALHGRKIRVLPQILGQLNIMLHGLDIPPSVPIGPRLYIPHPVGTVVTAERIGGGLSMVSAITIGMRNELRFPVIGDNVYIGAGARILGGITIGNDAKIGANAVVLQDVPAEAIAVGVPARIRLTTNGKLQPATSSGDGSRPSDRSKLGSPGLKQLAVRRLRAGASVGVVELASLQEHQKQVQHQPS